MKLAQPGLRTACDLLVPPLDVAVGTLTIVCFLAASPVADAQETSFRTITISLGIERIGVANPFASRWAPDARISMLLRSPIDLGTLEVGFRSGRLRPRPNADVPAVRVFEPHLGWTLARGLGSHLTASSGLQLGFERQYTEIHPLQETELTLGPVARLDWSVSNRWSVTFEGSARTTYTTPRTWTRAAGVRLSGRLRAPRVVSNALRDGGPTPVSSEGSSPPPGSCSIGALLDRAGVWSGTTLNGGTWGFSSRGMNAPGSAQPEIVIDGVIIKTGLFDIVPFHTLPLDTESVRCIRSEALPTPGLGGIARDGRILLTASPTRRGLSTWGTYGATNETGDPGLWLFFDPDVRNVDRMGDRWTGGVTLSGTRGWIEVGGGHSTFWVAEHPIIRRIKATYVNTPGAVGRDPAVSSDPRWIRGQWASGRVAVAGVWFDSHVDDFLFLPQVGRELPAETRMRGGSATATVGDLGAGSLEMYVGWSEVELRERDNNIDFRADLPLRRWNADARFVTALGAWSGTVGLGLNGLSLRAASPPSDPTDATARTTVSLGHRRSGVRFTAETLITEGIADLGGIFAWTSPADSAIRVQLSSLPSPRSSETSLARWRAEGVTDLDALIRPTRGSWVGGGRVWGIDIERTVAERRAITIRAGGFARRHTGISLPRRTQEFVPEEGRFLVESEWLSLQGGSVVGAWLHADVTRTPEFVAQLRYEAQGIASGSDLFRSVFSLVPSHHLRANGRWSLPGGLRLLAGLGGRTSVYWKEYEGLEAASGADFSERVSGSWAFDAGVEKLLIGGRIKGRVMVRNVLNAPEQWHPIGLILGRRIDVLVRGVGSLGDLAALLR